MVSFSFSSFGFSLLALSLLIGVGGAPCLPASFVVSTVDDVTALAERCATEAKNTGAGDYGNVTLMNTLIDSLNDTASVLMERCIQLPQAAALQAAASCANATVSISAAQDTLATMRDIVVEEEIIILFGRYWRPNACLGGRSFGAPAYGAPKCFDVAENVTIHGIWPSSPNPRVFPNPVNCSDPLDLTQADIGGLEDQLNEEWVSYYPIWPENFQFWQWEWFKHGSCWDRTKQEFLQQALDWQAQFDVPQILADQGIPLGEMVNTSDVLQKLTANMWGARMGLLCIGDGIYVDQLFSCWDYAGTTPIDCPPASQCKEEVMFRVYHDSDIVADTDDTTSTSTNGGTSGAATGRTTGSCLHSVLTAAIMAIAAIVFD